jgi:hypothetical protein
MPHAIAGILSEYSLVGSISDPECGARRTPRKQATAQVIRLCLTHEQTMPIWFMPLRCVK